MRTIELSIPDLPYAAEEALNRLRVNVKFSGKGKVNDHFALSLTNSLEKTAKIIKLTLAEGIESAGIYSLNFQDLKSVKLPGSLKKIDSFTFRGCTRLKKQ